MFDDNKLYLTDDPRSSRSAATAHWLIGEARGEARLSSNSVAEWHTPGET